jgi:Excalibur calcium-binding domain
MSFKKEFRATPVRLGPYHRGAQRRQFLSKATKVLGLAAVGGLTFGSLIAFHNRGELSPALSAASEFAASLGISRRSTPQSGDYWSGCDDARIAGVTPLYRGEPGYRPEMDGDDDGIACEPYRRN